MDIGVNKNFTNLFLITASVYGGKNIFLEPDLAGIALSSFNQFHTDWKIFLYAYSIMPTVIYVILKLRNITREELLEDVDATTTENILNQLKLANRTLLYQFFNNHLNLRRQKSIWQGIAAIKITSPEALKQRLEFIHNTPLDKQWQFVQDRADFRYSSACYYDRGEAAVIPLDDARELNS